MSTTGQSEPRQQIDSDQLLDAMHDLTESVSLLTESMTQAADGFDAMAKENTKLGTASVETNASLTTHAVADD